MLLRFGGEVVGTACRRRVCLLTSAAFALFGVLPFEWDLELLGTPPNGIFAVTTPSPALLPRSFPSSPPSPPPLPPIPTPAENEATGMDEAGGLGGLEGLELGTFAVMVTEGGIDAVIEIGIGIGIRTEVGVAAEVKLIVGGIEEVIEGGFEEVIKGVVESGVDVPFGNFAVVVVVVVVGRLEDLG